MEEIENGKEIVSIFKWLLVGCTNTQGRAEKQLVWNYMAWTLPTQSVDCGLPAMATPQTHNKCRFSGHTPNLLNHNLHFNKIPNDSYVL